jgi:hypothetical protein
MRRTRLSGHDHAVGRNVDSRFNSGEGTDRKEEQGIGKGKSFLSNHFLQLITCLKDLKTSLELFFLCLGK